MMPMRNVAISVILGACLLGYAPDIQSQDISPESCRYFLRTGQYVCGRFLDVFQTQGGLEIFGYPTTREFIDPTHGRLPVQYFQRARLEKHLYNAPPYDVQLGLLVDELGVDYPPALAEELPDPRDSAHRYFPETQHVVSFAFLEFFRQHGGVDIFGYPRSEIVYENGLVVQYFQRARMEWHRSNPPGHQIILSNVGDWYGERFDLPGFADSHRILSGRGETGGTSRDQPPYLVFLPLMLAHSGGGKPSGAENGAGSEIAALSVSASVRYPVSGRTGRQTAFIYANDQEGRPVVGAVAVLSIHYASEDVPCVSHPTDASGYTWCSFDIPSPPTGEQVVIDITVTHQDLTATTQTFFMPWW